ncbi:S8 family peptidase [Chryseobacterium defluvii]|uniref:Putative secreted protein (Por secretion system target) n=1 Tax=Chryseobacterium defluvii TaxID=160396 RepID=A0A495SCE8_9FLAO|nr:S8 family peptidase [Chryseobacterium defluvii]RKS97665.1 putative secreted protein (Por secretion system target) [Chryseobacterium defluvii]
MKKHLLLVSTLAITLISAQSNEALHRRFDQQKAVKQQAFNNYVNSNYNTIDLNKDSDLKEKLEDLSTRVAFVFDGKPFFFTTEDTRQGLNANADALNTAGNIVGLSGAFNGENIKYTVFDGGRVYAPHTAFANATGRITNLEATTQSYSDHATGVAGFIGARSVAVSGGGLNGNIKGIAINSTIDSYRFATTTLPGQSSPSDVFDKILLANPNISNHSYGSNGGWLWGPSYGLPQSAWYWNGSYSGGTSGTAYDLQGAYLDNDANYDDIVYQNPSNIIVKSAGNYFGDGPTGSAVTTAYYSTGSGYTLFPAGATLPPNNCSNGADCITNGSLAKNIIVVAATDVITTNNFKYTTSSDVVHSSYSSAGPRDDGGIKPDIATTGTDVFYPASSTTGSETYGYGSGTSFSAPVITGIIGLWTQINKQLFAGSLLNAASAKTLLVHSAQEAGNVGPDPLFGWGYADAKKGAEILVGKSNGTVIFNNETLTSGVANKKLVKASGSEPLKVTISWIDPALTNLPTTYQAAHNNRTSRLINDMDLRIIDTTSNLIYYPWKLNAASPNTPATKADNTVDNVEQVVIDAPVAGRNYRIEITNKGTLVDNVGSNNPQNYSIIVTGHSEQVLGTKESEIANGIIIAPTVTKDIVKVLKAPKKSTFNVYDLSGKKLQNGAINSDQESVDLSSYPKGIYIVEVKTDKDVISKKVIKE